MFRFVKISQRITLLLSGEVPLPPASSSSKSEKSDSASPAAPETEQPHREDETDESAVTKTTFSAPLREALSQLLPVVKVG